MDCGAAGQIVLSKAAPELIKQDSGWCDHVDYLGERVVKHDLKLQLYSLETHLVVDPDSRRAADQAPVLDGTLTSEILSHTTSNPRYNDDLLRLDRNYQLAAVIGRETIIIVVGATVIAELLDRSAAEALSDQSDAKGGGHPFRRAIVVCDQTWFENKNILGSKAVIAVGGPELNKLTAEFDQRRIAPTGEAKYSIAPGVSGFYQKGSAELPQVGLWGNGWAAGTRHAVEAYVERPNGLSELLAICWG